MSICHKALKDGIAIFIFEKRASVSPLMFSAKQGNHWYHFFKHLWYDEVLYRGLNPGPPALEASTLPLGYQGRRIWHHTITTSRF